MKKFYKEKFEKGKDIAKEWKDEAKDVAEDLAAKGSIVVDDFVDQTADLISDNENEAIEIEDEKEVPSSSKESSATEFVKKAFEDDPLVKLKELGELKSSGVITEEEFEKMKKKIIDDF